MEKPQEPPPTVVQKPKRPRLSVLEVVTGITSCLVSLAGLAWVFLQGMIMAMEYSTAAGGGPIPEVHISKTVFLLPTLAIAMAACVFLSAHRRGRTQAALWIVTPALALSIFTILGALDSL